MVIPLLLGMTMFLILHYMCLMDEIVMDMVTWTKPFISSNHTSRYVQILDWWSIHHLIHQIKTAHEKVCQWRPLGISCCLGALGKFMEKQLNIKVLLAQSEGCTGNKLLVLLYMQVKQIQLNLCRILDKLFIRIQQCPLKWRDPCSSLISNCITKSFMSYRLIIL